MLKTSFEPEKHLINNLLQLSQFPDVQPPHPSSCKVHLELRGTDQSAPHLHPIDSQQQHAGFNILRGVIHISQEQCEPLNDAFSLNDSGMYLFPQLATLSLQGSRVSSYKSYDVTGLKTTAHMLTVIRALYVKLRLRKTIYHIFSQAQKFYFRSKLYIMHSLANKKKSTVKVQA